MTDKHDKQAQAERLLKGAYALKNSKDNARYYRDFAPIYDEQFADALGYSYPSALAGIYMEQRQPDDNTAVLDVGCGTGLVAEALTSISKIDGVDLSADMLSIAENKRCYRQLYCHDLTTGPGPLPGDYGGVVSAGTFTHGHLGPDALQDLLVLGRPNALFCIGINAHHFEQADFKKAFAGFLENHAISDYTEVVCDIFTGSNSHVGDQAIVTVFRKM